jgi:serine protease Do
VIRKRSLFRLSEIGVVLTAAILVLLATGRGWSQDNGKPPKEPAKAPAAAPPEIVAAPKNAGELKQLQERIRQVVDTVLPCVVGVKIGAAGGSAVIVKEDGLMLTAGHVVGKPKQKVTVFLADGKTVNGTTLGMFKSADAGMMRITDKGKWPHVAVGQSDNLQRGQWCVAIGHPFGFRSDRPPVVRVGRILGASPTTIQTDCPLISGDSGGPLFDLDGNVIGINSRIGGSTSQNFHVPVDIFHENWERLAKGDSWQVDAPTRDGSPVKTAFRDVVSKAVPCVVRVKCDGKDRVLGTIVGPDGWVLTKASELNGKKIVCRFRDKKEVEARIVGVDEKYDLAMLKLDTNGLPNIEWNVTVPEVGTWVATAGMADEPLTVGAVSVGVREIPAVPPKLGVSITDGEKGPVIARVFPGTGGEKAGLKTKDMITHVNDREVKKREDVSNVIGQCRLGDAVKLKIKRGDKTLDLTATLSKIENDATRKRDIMNASNVGVSKRRDSFPTILQHDTVLKPTDCGGPLVDLSGKVVGVNIARGGRTETYCVPSDVVLSRLYDLMSGRLAPPEKAEEKAEPEAKKEEKEEEKEKEEKKPEEKPEPEKKPEASPEKKPDEGEKPAPEEKPEATPKEEPEQPTPEKKDPSPEETPKEKSNPDNKEGADEEAKPQPESGEPKPEEKPADDPNGEATPDKQPPGEEQPSPSNGNEPEPQPDGEPQPEKTPGSKEAPKAAA